MKGKKAQVEDWLPTILLIVVLVFLFFFFSISSANSAEKSKEQIEFQTSSIDSKQLLLIYLKTPFELDAIQNANIADAIAYYFTNLDEELLKQIKTETNEFFSKSQLESDRSSWSLDLTNPKKIKKITIDSEKTKKQISEGRLDRKSKIKLSETLVPSPIKDEFIQIQLFSVKTVYR
tara:strand:- start:3046 stop:3576 length:531 start_codon:yes stop_codon:yes gene_type:complete